MEAVYLQELTGLEFMRRNEGLRQRQLEEKLGLPAGRISLLERRRAQPSAEEAEALADYFFIDVRDLFLD